jgi:large subunit ribosomal protein L15
MSDDAKTQQQKKTGLHNLGSGAAKNKRRVGRGSGSGRGKTCGRGHKGQNSRAGGGVPPAFEGGQMPLIRRVPKRGFTSRGARECAQIRLSDLQRMKGDEITLDSLRAAGLLRFDGKRAKIIRAGKIKRAVTVKGVLTSAGARAAIERVGGAIG